MTHIDVTVTRPRAAITTQLREFFTAADIPVEDGYAGGGPVFIVDGRAYTPGGAAQRWLPGGFDGAYGQPGRLPRYRIGQQLRHVPADGPSVPVVVVDVLGAATYGDGYMALCRDADGRSWVITD